MTVFTRLVHLPGGFEQRGRVFRVHGCQRRQGGVLQRACAGHERAAIGIEQRLDLFRLQLDLRIFRSLARPRRLAAAHDEQVGRLEQLNDPAADFLPFFVGVRSLLGDAVFIGNHGDRFEEIVRARVHHRVHDVLDGGGFDKFGFRGLCSRARDRKQQQARQRRTATDLHAC